MVYAQDTEGTIHVVSPMQWEHTLCGYAFDVDMGDEKYQWKKLAGKRHKITCGECQRFVNYIKGKCAL